MSISKLRQKLKNDQKGFTLIEIIVVLAILAILIAIAIPTMNGVLTDAREKVVLSDARAAYIAYVLKSTETDNVTLSDVKAYIDKSSDDSVEIYIAKTGDTITHFYYTDDRLDDGNKYVDLPVGDSNSDKATIVTSTTGQVLTNTGLQDPD